MKAAMIAASLFLFTSPAFANLAECQKYMKRVEKTCKNSVKCKVSVMDVSGFDIVQTGTSVVCRGAHSMTGKKDRSPSARTKVSFKEKRRRFEF